MTATAAKPRAIGSSMTSDFCHKSGNSYHNSHVFKKKFKIISTAQSMYTRSIGVPYDKQNGKSIEMTPSDVRKLKSIA